MLALSTIATRLPRSLGRVTLQTVAALRDWLRLFAQTLRYAAGTRPDRRQLVGQLHVIGNGSLFFILVTMAFVSIVSVYQVCLQASQITGDISQVGPEFIRFMVHETGPTITAIMVATRVGAGIAAEIGSMVVTEQVDALRMCGVSPVAYLIVPRFWSCLLLMPALAIFGGAIGIVAGAAMAQVGFEINWHMFIDFSRVTGWEVLTGLVKCFAYGAVMPIVAAYCGLNTRGGSEGVGWATTRAVVYASLAVLVLDFVISSLAFTFLPMGTA